MRTRREMTGAAGCCDGEGGPDDARAVDLANELRPSIAAVVPRHHLVTRQVVRVVPARACNYNNNNFQTTSTELCYDRSHLKGALQNHQL